MIAKYRTRLTDYLIFENRATNSGFTLINMEKIASFTINHLKLGAGIYVSRIDDDIITYDLRIRKPYSDELLTVEEAHSLEHLLATEVRRGTLAKNVVYVGPMGCMTGFYVLLKGKKEGHVQEIKRAFGAILNYTQMPGDSKIECGNCKTLNLKTGIKIAKEYLQKIGEKTVADEYIV